MITGLNIQNFVLIEKSTIDFVSGFNAITGESGAGKSLILQAIECVFGAKVSSRFFRLPSEAIVIDINFTIERTSTIYIALFELLAGKNIKFTDSINIKRIIEYDGKSKFLINNIVVTAQMVAKLALLLVLRVGQKAHSELFKPDVQLGIIDEVGHIDTTLLNILYKNWKHKIAELEEQKRLNLSLLDIEYLTCAINEIEELAPEENEELRLIEQRKIYQDRQKIIDIGTNTLHDIKEINSKLFTVQKALNKVPDVFNEAYNRIDNIGIELDDIVNNVAAVVERFNKGDGLLSSIEDRIAALREIARKYELSTEELPNYLQKLKHHLLNVSKMRSCIENLEKEVVSAFKLYLEEADIVSEKRKETGLHFVTTVNKGISQLLMNNFIFGVKWGEFSEEHGTMCYTSKGYDVVSFVVSSNSSDFVQINNIASGGEISRLMLIIQDVISRSKNAGAIIFDEVDIGVSGMAADAIGYKMSELAQNKQIIAITHQPQVAVYANNHILVKKDHCDNEAKDVSFAQKLDEREKIEEIARMISGRVLTEESRKAASSMIKSIHNG